MLSISVKGAKRDWQSLERKISRGVTLEDAARQAGIPLEEVFTYVNERMGKVDTINWQLRLVAQSALEKSLTKLKELASEDVRLGKNFESTDLIAAKELARIALTAIKLSQTGKAPRDGDSSEKDLFDNSPDDPWDLKKVT